MQNDTHIILDKELRRDIDSIIQRLKDGEKEHDNPNPPDQEKMHRSDYLYSQKLPGRRSRERSLAITKLQEAVMWLGMDLKAINEENPGAVGNPYPHSKDPSTTIIDKTADGLKL